MTDSCIKTEVLILGAGAAGIAAAKHLTSAGIKDLIILEGNDYVGGRIKDTQFAGITVELGANWIQGIGNNPIWELAEKYQLRGEIDYREYIVRDFKGGDVTTKTAEDNIFEAQRQIYEKIIPSAQVKGLQDSSMREGLKQAGWVPDTVEKSAMEYWIVDWEYAVIPEVAPLKSELIAKTAPSIKSVSDQQYFVNDQRGFKFILESLTNEILHDNSKCLKLGSKVRKVEWNENGVRVTVHNGQQYLANYALMTFSLGVLQSDFVEFLPKIPKWKKDIISCHKMVLYNKIFLKFPYRFWDNIAYILYASTQRGHLQVWESLDAYKSFLRTTNVLLVTAIDNEAKRMEKMSKQKILSEIMQVLQSMYGMDIPDPEDILIADWGQDEMFRGCWTQPPIGVTQDHYSILQKPLGRLYFAGEGTHEHYDGYVHGGYLSGLERAADIIHHMKSNKNIETKHPVTNTINSVSSKI